MPSTSERPTAAVGHMFLRATDVGAAAKRLVAVGIRSVLVKEQLAILELRGGTHIVIRKLEEEPNFKASFDLMVDEVREAHRGFVAAGFEVTDIESGRIHSSFQVTAPEGFSIKVVDSHVAGRVV